MTSPDLSVVVPSYGGASRLPVLFESLREQDFAGVWELIVVLDGVVDDSLTVIESVDDLPVRVVVLDENRGRSAALNAGFAAANGGVLIRCDDDLEPAPTYLSGHHQAHADVSESPVGIVGLYRNDFGDSAFARSYGRRYDAQVRARAYAGALGDAWLLWAGNASVTRATFEQVGPYDESFREYGWEDIDWGYRLAQLGVPIELRPELEVRHHAANNSVAIRVRRAYFSGMARVRFDAKHGTKYEVNRPTGAKANIWFGLVQGFARLGNVDRFEWLGNRVEPLLGRIPEEVGFRMVSLLADAAALAGYRAGSKSD